MVHRGPDDEGYEQLPLGCEGGAEAGFGFRRLAILDLTAAAHQPMVHRETGDCLIFNGEIYNFRWLRAKLESQGVRIRSTGDTEVLLNALSRWGEDALDSIDGMFAFAFYHAATRKILLARDPFGIKPLYIAHAAGAFVFASEVRAVLASGMVPDELDPAGIATMLAYGAPQDPLTVHRAIRSFPAGSCQWLEAEVAQGRVLGAPRRYWRFPDPVAEVSEADAVRKVQLQLNASVRDQCISDVPIGVFLSGGIDSATLAALACRHSARLRTYSIGFESDRAGDETAAAAETALEIGTIHHETILDDEWGALQCHAWLKAADRPSIDGLNSYVVSEVVKNGGATVALSGIGADEIFGGYDHFGTIRRLSRYLALANWFPPAMRRGAAGCALAGVRATTREKAMDIAAGPATVLDLAIASRRVSSNASLTRLGLPHWELGLSSSYLSPTAYERLPASDHDAFRVISRAECSLYMKNTLLRDADVNSMAHSLEVRVPFLGRTISDFVTGLPSSMCAPPGTPRKHLLRAAMRGVVPESVFARQKKGFTLPIGDWMRGSMREACESALRNLKTLPMLEWAEVERIWQAFVRDPAAMHWSRPFALIVLGSYLGAICGNRARASAGARESSMVF